MNPWDILVLLAVATGLALALRSCLRGLRQKKGCWGCGGSCAACPKGCDGKKR